MYKKIIVFFSLFVATISVAQLKKITLEESVLQQNRKFRADKFLGFQWIPNTNKYTYFADLGKKLMVANTADTQATELVTLANVNTATTGDFKSFGSITWKDANTFTLTNANKYYEYNIQTKSGKLVNDIGDTAENVTFDTNHKIAAFTEKNNLYILDANN